MNFLNIPYRHEKLFIYMWCLGQKLFMKKLSAKNIKSETYLADWIISTDLNH